MEASWQILHRAGLPLAGERVGSVPPVDELARCVLELVMSGDGSAREREALAAFVLAWADEWPHTFARSFREQASELATWAEQMASDANRRIKLRRIAIENLSSVL